jgi:hypothetical protein
MKFVPFVVAIVIGLLFGPGRTVHAETPSVISKISAEDLADLLSKVGFFALVDEDNGEKVVIPIGFFNHRTRSEVRLLQCDADGCGRLVFKTWPQLRADLKWTNKWNGGTPNGLIKTSLLKDGTIRVEMTVDLAGGVSREFIEQSAFAFVTLMDRIYPNTGLN